MPGEGRKKHYKYQDLARELKKQWNMKMTVIIIIVGALGTTTQNTENRFDEKEIRGRIETI